MRHHRVGYGSSRTAGTGSMLTAGQDDGPGVTLHTAGVVMRRPQKAALLLHSFERLAPAPDDDSEKRHSH